MDRFSSMQVYCRVVMRESFSRAARDLGISPAMASRHVAALESHLGVRLLRRTTRRVSPTESGKRYYEQCRNVLDALEEIESDLAHAEREPEGILRISCPLDFGVLRLAPLLSDYLERYPRIRIDADFNDRKVNLVEEGIDLAVRIGGMEDSTLVAKRLADLTFSCCAAPAYLERRGVPRTPEELADHDCITYSYSSTGNDWRFDRDGKRYTVRVAGRFNSTNGRASVRVAVEGAGIVMKPDFMVAEELADGRLVAVLGDYRIPPTSIYAVYPHRRFLPGRVRRFVDYLKEKLVS